MRHNSPDRKGVFACVVLAVGLCAVQVFRISAAIEHLLHVTVDVARADVVVSVVRHLQKAQMRTCTHVVSTCSCSCVCVCVCVCVCARVGEGFTQARQSSSASQFSKPSQVRAGRQLRQGADHPHTHHGRWVPANAVNHVLCQLLIHRVAVRDFVLSNASQWS
jgi:hypothetical protein